MDARAAVAASLAAGAILVTLGLAETSRRNVHTLLEKATTTSGQIRDLDRAGRDCRGTSEERANAAQALLEASHNTPYLQQREALEAARVCVLGSDCGQCLVDALHKAELLYSRSLALAWKETDAQQEWTRYVMVFSAFCCLLAVAVIIFLRSDEELPVPPATPDVGAMEALLRARLEALYASRLREVQAERFSYFGEAAAGLSHGLKTPLSGVRAAATVALAKIGEEHPAAANLADIINEVDALVEQVNLFLGTARTGAPALMKLPAARLLDGLLERCGAEAERKSVSFSREVTAGEALVDVDPGLIQMALANLVDNALAPSPRGSTITLAVRPADPPARAGMDDAPPAARRWIEVAVEDRGPGMPSEVANAQRQLTTKPQGSGLGVAITRRILARHGGAVRFVARTGGGTSASILLPVIEEEPA